MRSKHYFIMALLTTAIAFAGGIDIDTLKKNVTIEQDYSIDKDITFTLAKNQAIKLTLSDDPYEFSECYMYWCDSEDVGELIYIIFYDRNQNILSQAGSTSRIGALRQVGRLPYLSIAKWKKDNKKLFVEFCISSDKQKNTEMVDLAAKLRQTGKETYSVMTKNWDALVAAELTETEKITGFVRLWSEVKYNFALFDHVPDVNWDQVLVDYLPKVQKAKDVFEYYKIMKQCIALLKDGHTGVYGPSLHPSDQPPLKIQPIQGKAFITEVIPAEHLGCRENQEMLTKANIKPGDEITHIDGVPIKERLEKDFYPYISASTPQWRDIKAFPDLLKGSANSTVTLRIKKSDGTTQDISLIRKNYTFKGLPNPFKVEKLPDDIFYVNLDGFSSDKIVKQFESALPEIIESKGLILDVRQNGGGSSSYGEDIIQHLIDKPIEDTLWKTPKHIAAYKAWGRKNEDWFYGQKELIQPHPDKPFTGPVVVLTSAETFSAAEDFTVVLHAARRALIVGQRTGGSTGQPLQVKDLPGGGSARICTKWDTYPDGHDFVGVGVIPDVEVYPTLQDIAAGKDTILQEGIRQIKLLIEKQKLAASS